MTRRLMNDRVDEGAASALAGARVARFARDQRPALAAVARLTPVPPQSPGVARLRVGLFSCSSQR